MRQRFQDGTDRLLAAVLTGLLVGTPLAFGGAVWWAGPFVALLTFVFALACLVRIALEGRMKLLKSPLTLLGVLALFLALLQLAPLPPKLATRFSPRSHQVYAQGFYPDRVRALDASVELPPPVEIRSPITVDRSGTLRWLLSASLCLVLFWGVAYYTDRLRRLYLVWGCLLAVFFLNTGFAVVQIVGHTSGLYGMFVPGRGPSFAPTVNDMMSTPNALVLRAAPGASPTHPSWAVQTPDQPFAIGTLMGGPAAFLALASFCLPLALGLVMQLLSPRGSRERLSVRLGDSGQGGLVFLLMSLMLTAAVVAGILAGPWLSLPFAFALALVGLPSTWGSGLRWTGVGITFLALTALGSGVGIHELQKVLPRSTPPVAAESLTSASLVWKDSLSIIRDFPVFGSGFGSFASIYPFYKSQDESRTTALSSLLQWCVESGGVGAALLLLGALWCLYRLPGAVRRVGTADRALVFGLIGAAAGFSLYAAVHWTVELSAVAIAVSALGGACNRWLAGGTDLFVERG